MTYGRERKAGSTWSVPTADEKLRVSPMEREFEMENQGCPTCGVTLNAATNLTSYNKPTPGDITICAYCQSILGFTPEMKLRIVDEKEMKGWGKEEREVITEAVQQLRVLAAEKSTASSE